VFRNDGRFIRHCERLSNDEELHRTEGCRSTTNGQQTTCYCRTDFCNRADGPSSMHLHWIGVGITAILMRTVG
jgi:hypothetical protein